MKTNIQGTANGYGSGIDSSGVMQQGGVPWWRKGVTGMSRKQGKGQKPKKRSSPALRASVSFAPDVYRTLEGIAKEKKVSVAWVVRDAVDNYVEDKWPLFRMQG